MEQVVAECVNVERIKCCTNSKCARAQEMSFKPKQLREWLKPDVSIPKQKQCPECGTERKIGEGITMEGHQILYYGNKLPNRSYDVNKEYMEFVKKVQSGDPEFVQASEIYSDESMDYYKDYEVYVTYLHYYYPGTGGVGGYWRYKTYLSRLENSLSLESTLEGMKPMIQHILDEANNIKWAVLMKKEFLYYYRCEKYSKYVRDILEIVAENEDEFDQYRCWDRHHGYISYLLFRHDNDRDVADAYSKIIKRFKRHIKKNINQMSPMELFPEAILDIFQGIVDEYKSINKFFSKLPQ